MAWVFILFLAPLISGCASVFFNDYKQVVLVQSDPAGVEIYNEDGEILGVTPAYVKVRRGREAKLTLKSKADEVKSLTLDSRYRWSPSFYGNLVFLTGAPIGWGVDYLTKTAFQYYNPESVSFDRNTSQRDPKHSATTVIAPPPSEYVSLSREAAELIERELKRKYPSERVLDYQETRPVFSKFHWRNDVKADQEYFEKIMYELHADRYAESTIHENAQSVRIEVVLHDAFTKKFIDSFVIERPKEDFKIYRSPKILRLLSSYFTFAPNAVGIDFTNYSSSFELPAHAALPGGVTTIKGERLSGSGIDQMINLVGSLNILYVRPPRTTSGVEWKLLFVPSLYASTVTFKYPQLTDINEVAFRRWRVGLGYGPQLSANTRYGLFYLAYIPTYNYTEITWHAQGSPGRSEVGEVVLLMEGGYQLFLSNSLAFRIFAKTWNENATRWSQILTAARNQSTEINMANVSLGGVSVIWYWPGLQDKTVQWLGGH